MRPKIKKNQSCGLGFLFKKMKTCVARNLLKKRAQPTKTRLHETVLADTSPEPLCQNPNCRFRTTTKFYFAKHLKIDSEAGRKKNASVTH